MGSTYRTGENMTNTKEIILKLKEVRLEKNLSFGNIIELMERNGDYLSKSTISRVFADGSENNSFRYDETIRPIAKALLDIENEEEDDDIDIQAMKALLKYKIERIEELEKKLADEKLKYHEKIDKEREQYSKRIDFLLNQIALKDKRMDQLLEAVFTKDSQHKELLDVILACPARKDCPDGKS